MDKTTKVDVSNDNNSLTITPSNHHITKSTHFSFFTDAIKSRNKKGTNFVVVDQSLSIDGEQSVTSKDASKQVTPPKSISKAKNRFSSYATNVVKASSSIPFEYVG